MPLPEAGRRKEDVKKPPNPEGFGGKRVFSALQSAQVAAPGVGAPQSLAQRQNGIHTKLYEALASGDTEAACRAVYAHYMEPMERMRSANSAVQAADETAK